jgi:hypothetical protein
MDRLLNRAPAAADADADDDGSLRVKRVVDRSTGLNVVALPRRGALMRSAAPTAGRADGGVAAPAPTSIFGAGAGAGAGAPPASPLRMAAPGSLLRLDDASMAGTAGAGPGAASRLLPRFRRLPACSP